MVFPDKSMKTFDVTGNEYHTYEPTCGCCRGSSHVIWKTRNSSHVDAKHLKVKSWQTCIVFIFHYGRSQERTCAGFTRSWCTRAFKASPVTYPWHSNCTVWAGAISSDGCTLSLQTGGHVLCPPAPTKQVKHILRLSAALWVQVWIYGTLTLWYISDSPQVQCIQSYSSQEPDELSIEMADVLNLLERTDDGL